MLLDTDSHCPFVTRSFARKARERLGELQDSRDSRMAKGWKPSTHVSVVCACSIKRLVHVLIYSCHCDAFSSPAPAGSKRRPFCDCRRVVLTGKSCFDGAICMQRHRTPTPALLDSQLTETATIIPLQRQRPSAHGCLRLRTQKLVQMQGAHLQARVSSQRSGVGSAPCSNIMQTRPTSPRKARQAYQHQKLFSGLYRAGSHCCS